MLSVSCFLCVLAVASAIEIPNLHGPAYLDLVDSLPGVPPFKSAAYSGYLDVNKTGKALHYFFVESQRNPYLDPLVIWTNGGPGCSSMLGLVREHGPFYMEEESENFHSNPFAWNLAANILYIEHPAGVGYSLVNDTA